MATIEKPVEVISKEIGEAAKFTEKELAETLETARKILLSETEGCVIVISKNGDDGTGAIKVGGMKTSTVIDVIARALGVGPLTMLAIGMDIAKQTNAETTQPKTTDEAQKEGTESAEGAKE